MKKFFVIIVLLIESAAGWCQVNVEDILVGDWLVRGQFGDSGIFHFDKNKTMFISSPLIEMGRGEMEVAGGRKVKTLMKYELNLKAKPIQIDFYFFADNFYNPIAKSEGILEILDNNSIRFAMDFSRPASVRPKNFENLQASTVLLRVNAPNEVKDCERFRDGKFKMKDAIVGTIVIERSGEVQIQTTEKGEKVRCKVEWLDNCSYNLIPLEHYSNRTWSPDTTGLIMNVQILHTKKRSYIYTSTYNKSNARLTGELVKIKD